MMDPIEVIWYEHPLMVAVNDFVEKEFKNNKAFLDEYYRQGESNFVSFKEEMRDLIKDWRGKFDALEVYVENLPDDVRTEYKINWNES